MSDTELTNIQKIGVSLSGIGVLYILLGACVFSTTLFNYGNISFICGLTIVVGIEKAIWFFFQPDKRLGMIAFFSGMYVISIGLPPIGMVMQIYGLYILFKDFLDEVFDFLMSWPLLKYSIKALLRSLFSYMVIKKIIERKDVPHREERTEVRTHDSGYSCHRMEC